MAAPFTTKPLASFCEIAVVLLWPSCGSSTKRYSRRMQVRILGPIEVTIDNEPVVLGGAKQRSVLAALASRHGQVVSSDELIEDVWGDDLPSNPLNTLQYQIAQLRKLIEDDSSSPRFLVTRSPGYLLDPGTTSLDASTFDTLVQKGRTALAEGDDVLAAELVDEALSLWRGPALADFRYDDFAQSYAASLDDARLAAEELRIAISLSSGHHTEVIPRLTRLVSEHPLREGLWAQQMVALYRDGQQTEALRAYQNARAALGDVGIDPSTELRALEQQIIEQDPTLDGPERPATRTQNNLPIAPNSLVGRDQTVTDILSALAGSRLITLTGPGGSGKTRLAIEAAEQSLERFDGGVWFVPLDQIDEPLLVPAFVGSTIGMKERPDVDVADNIAATLGVRPVLLVLDNAEHIVDATAELTASLLTKCPNLTVMVTSQALLDVHREVVFGVEPLSLPGNTSSIFDRLENVDAVALFLERTTAGGTATDNWDDESYAAVANIVAALDGMPLAIELAAARTRSMSLSEIADGLNDRFDLLSRGPRDAPPRQRTLIGTMEWSVGLLTPTQRSALNRLSVCTSDFDAATAASITEMSSEDLRDILAALVDRSLLRRTDDVAGVARFAMLETLRHYGIESMAPSDLSEARNAHLRTFASFVEQAAEGICGPDQMTWLSRINADYANIRAALGWSLESGDLDTGMLLGGRLGRYWDWTGLLKEADEWLTRLSEADSQNRAGRVEVLAWRSFLAWEFGDTETARHLNEAAHAVALLSRDPMERVNAASTRALIARSTGDLETAREASIEIIALGDEHGGEWMAAWAASALATIALASGDASAAETHARDTITRFERIGDRRGTGWGLVACAQADLAQGELETARDHARQALSASFDTQDDRNVSWALELLAEIAHAQAQYEHSAQLWGAARPLREDRGLTTSISHQDDPIDLEQSLRGHLGDSYDSLFAGATADPQSIVDEELNR
jgi:predicted ATPase/DNA-binding SARP family transcriptional activator